MFSNFGAVSVSPQINPATMLILACPGEQKHLGLCLFQNIQSTHNVQQLYRFDEIFIYCTAGKKKSVLFMCFDFDSDNN